MITITLSINDSAQFEGIFLHLHSILLLIEKDTLGRIGRPQGILVHSSFQALFTPITDMMLSFTTKNKNEELEYISTGAIEQAYTIKCTPCVTDIHFQLTFALYEKKIKNKCLENRSATGASCITNSFPHKAINLHWVNQWRK